jgi:hypothetical protein
MSKDNISGDAFFEGYVVPQLKKDTEEYLEQINYRLGSAKVVSTLSKRDALRQLDKGIETQLQKIREGADPLEFIAGMTEVIAARNEGQFSLISRIRAAQGIGQAISETGVELGAYPQVAHKLNQAIRTAPEMREPLILAGVIKGSSESEKYDKRPVWNSVKGKPITHSLYSNPDDLLSNAPDELDRWLRRSGVEFVARLAAQGKIDLVMGLDKWRTMTGEPVMWLSGDQRGQPTVPEMVLRLSQRYVEDAEVGARVMKGKVCSPELQNIAAVLGVPRKGKFWQGEELDLRNLTVVLTEEVKAGDHTTTINRGIALDTLPSIPSGQLDKIRSEEERRNGGLQEIIAKDILPFSSIAAIEAIRVSRSVDVTDSSDIVETVISRRLTRLKKEISLNVVRDGKVEVTNTSLLTSLVGEFNRNRGAVEGEVINEAQAEEALGVLIHAMVLVSDNGHVRPRREHEIVALTKSLAIKSLPEEERKQFPGLVQNGTIKMETIRRKSVSATPDSIIDESGVISGS